MFNRTSDQQTLHTLRALHSSGMLSGAEGLDDQIASDLLNGSSGNSRKSSMQTDITSTGPLRKVPTPTRLAPLKGAPHLAAPSDIGLTFTKDTKHNLGNLTSDYIKQLQQECDKFNSRLEDNTTDATSVMQDAVVKLFQSTAKDKLPDCFLRSLPKWGKGGTTKGMTQIFNKSLNKKKTENQVDRNEAPFTLTIQADVLDEFKEEVHNVIEGEMKRCFGTVTADLQRILKSVLKLKDRMENLEEELLKEQTEMRVLKEKLNDSSEQIAEVQDRMEQLQTQAREKDIQMDILSDQVKRRNLMLDEQRARFHKEVMRYKTKIYELNHKLDSALPAGEFGRRHSGVGGELEMQANPVNPAESVEVMEAVDNATRDLREQMLENIRKLKAEHAREKKELLHQKKIAMDERDNEIYHLKMNITSMDRIIEVEKRRLVKNRELELKEIQEKYEQKISALTGEIQHLKNKYETTNA
eukprot:TRINITY_DN67355_c2_g1_i1.p1 TRINITY_DN67355_c2_g1~~TRINITY_DN67355_c2_g1_i1.p1  ORF type:complete len:469 (+),score=58.29 TRINITY_DN67355_c2_g1_i1:52-1458(+)